ncbi:MAG TPA: glycosyltransferase family 2 protein [Candidatus Peribacterales bacterium]|nr:glycosyltransferase family 2 protein [Candidatus Peribacterales bacterium]
MQRVLVVVPTYNERENIESLLEEILSLPGNLHILVIDDASPDGTAQLVQNAQNLYGRDRLHLILRSGGKAGRGSACMEGFRFARAQGYGTALEMDADFSHDPKDIPRIFEKFQEGADVVIASKHLPGSRIIGWSLRRHFLSFAANLYARMVLPLPITDYTNGFRCYGPRALALLPDLPVSGSGFTVIPQTTYLLARAGMCLMEVPVTFKNRQRGSSNLGLHEIIESIFALLCIRSESLHRHVIQILKFGMTGIVNATLDLLLFAFFVQIASFPIVAAGPAVSVIVLTNVFFMNKYWTFRNGEKKHLSQGAKFLTVYAVSFVLVNALTWVLAVPLKLWYLLARAIAILICAVWNYLWLHFHVFTGQIKPGASRVTDPHAL